MSKLEQNPKRPPKQWWNRCVAGVEESNRLYDRDADARSVCGSLWYHKMRASDKRTITRMAEAGRHEELEENPIGAGGLFLFAAAAAGLAWLLTRKKEAPPTPQLPPSYVTTTCTIDEKTLDAWGKAMGVSILVSSPSGAAAPYGASVMSTLAWNPGESYLRGLNKITTPDALATKSYCDWAKEHPAPNASSPLKTVTETKDTASSALQPAAPAPASSSASSKANI